MPATAPAFAAYEQFYPAEPREARDRQASLQEHVEVLRQLAQARLAGLVELRNYAHQPGFNLESLLHFVRHIEGEMRHHVKGDTKEVKLMRRKLRAARRDGLSTRDLDALRATVVAVEQVASIDQNLLGAVRSCRHEVEELRSARLNEYSAEWSAYLDQLAADSTTAAIAVAAKRFWEWIAPRALGPANSM